MPRRCLVKISTTKYQLPQILAFDMQKFPYGGIVGRQLELKASAPPFDRVVPARLNLVVDILTLNRPRYITEIPGFNQINRGIEPENYSFDHGIPGSTFPEIPTLITQYLKDTIH